MSGRALRSLRPGPWIAVLAAVAALGALGLAPAALARAASAALFVGAAWPLLAWLSPVEPDGAKVCALSGALSPALLAALYFALRAQLAPDRALAATWLAVGLAALAASRLRARVSPPGRALAWTAAAALACGAWVAFALGAPDGRGALARAALVAALAEHAGARALPSPFLAGAVWPHAFATEALGAFAAPALGIGPARALAFCAALAATWIPISAYFALAPLGWDGARLAAAGLAAAAALASFAPPSGALAPLVLATSAAAAAWLACAHALRHGRRPWVELTGLFHALAFAFEPAVGAASAAGVAAAAILAPGEPIARPRVLLALALGSALPALWLRARGGVEPPLFEPAGLVLGASAGLALAALGGLAAAALAPYLRRSAAGPRSVAAAVLATALGFALAARFVPRSAALAPIALAILFSAAAALPVALWQARRRAGALALGALLAFVPPALACARAGRGAGRDPSSEAGPGELDRRRALDWLARARAERAFDRPVALVQNPDAHPPWPGADRGAWPALAELAEFAVCDPELAPGPRRGPRCAALRRLYSTPAGFDAEIVHEAGELGIGLAVLVTAADRRETPYLVQKFPPRGFAVLHVAGSAALFGWPASLAEALPESDRDFPLEHVPSGR